jgi:hypothetical protein
MGFENLHLASEYIKKIMILALYYSLGLINNGLIEMTFVKKKGDIMF